ncbi:Uncharacterized protein LB4E_2330 [Leptospira borgpetersenii str. 4E]|nr:Uncharacterized protein LB4E_2330 [Leptospira borgpetersenii str. 4E]
MKCFRKKSFAWVSLDSVLLFSMFLVSSPSAIFINKTIKFKLIERPIGREIVVASGALCEDS